MARIDYCFGKHLPSVEDRQQLKLDAKVIAGDGVTISTKDYIEAAQDKINDHRNEIASISNSAWEKFKQTPQYLKEYPSAQETANTSHDTTDVSKKSENSDTYHPAIKSLASDLTVGGGVGVVINEHDVITGRTPSLNPEWFKDGAFITLDDKGNQTKDKSSVKDIQTAVDDHYAGKRLTPKQKRILSSLSNVAHELEQAGNNSHPENYDFEQTLLDNDLELQLNNGNISIEDVQAALDEFDDSIPFNVKGDDLSIQQLDDFFGITNEERESEGSAGGDTQEALTGYTEAELATKEREQAQREKQAAADELKAKQKEEADKSIDGFADEMLGNTGTQDIFGGNPLANLGRADAVTQSKSATENIQDLGEKIGGARKDTSNKTGPTGVKKAVDDRPTWAKRFSITELTQVGGLVQADDGKWIIRDSKSKDWRGQARTLATFDTEQEAKDALPLLAVAIKHRVTTGSKDENGDYNYEIWRNINDRKRVKVVDKSFKTREEAMQYMAQNAQAILETNTTFGESDLPVPENKQRTGKAHRDGDVNGESFMHTFGIRGVEFGNWNNQDERQEVMNAAYDGLMDLSEVLSIPPTAIGLNGELALAFGARGAGLSSAKAHYELQKSVINLTKMNGAGALAHEWLHALDHYLGRLDGKADANWVVAADGTRSFKITTAEDSFVSSGFKHNSGVREALRDAFKHVMETIFHKAETYISDTKQADNFVARTKEGLANELDRLRKDLSQQKDIQYYKRNNKPASAEQLIEFDTVASQLLNGDALETQFVLNEKQTRRLGMAGRQTNEQLDKISAIYKAVRGRSGFDATHQNGVMDRIRQSMRLYDQRLQQLAFANSNEEKIKKVPTSFAMDAKELDQGRGGDYWTTAHEMAARAFQGYVEDKMAEQEGRNPFLNYAPANFKMVTPWGGKRVFPHGEERKAINAAFDKFVAILETKKTDKGTMLFSRSQSTKERYEQRIDELFSGSAPSNRDGVRVLDKSDVLDMLGYGGHEVVLAEKHAIGDGIYNHGLTADDWKKIPEWLENPVAVFNRDDGHITIVAPELKNGQPIIIGLRPEVGAQGDRSKKLHVVLTAFNKDKGKLPIARIIQRV